MGQRKRYVVAGSGSRGLHMYAKPLLKDFPEYSELAGLFDHNLPRLEAANEILGTKLPLYTDFQEMLREVRPDGVIITTRDSTHAEYIVQSLEAGARAISEKPLCVDGKQCRTILNAAKKNRKKARCFVTHNMRYGPEETEIKRLIEAGELGQVKSMNFHENLDRRHGADYFRRWHRIKKNSGGLLIHKASHHFDFLNWIAGSQPELLTAQGGLLFYGKNGPFRHPRCEGCPHASRCDFHVDLWSQKDTRRLYKDAEKADGYIRDACVFDRKIDIEDQAAVLYTYANGIHVTYSLTAFATYEGMDLQIEGSGGRLELKTIHNTSFAAGNAVVQGMDKLTGQQFVLYRPKEGIRKLEVPQLPGSHGGSDPQLLHDFFGRPFDTPPTERMAPVEEAVQAVLIGHAANVSIAKESKPVQVQDFLKRG